MPQKIAVMVGSLRQGSMNLKLAKALIKLAGDKVEATFVDISQLPLFNEELEGNVPAAVTTMRESIKAADGLLIVTPEYNRSVTGVLKNAIDWASRPYGQSAFAGKPAAIAGAAPGTIGTACAQQHLISILKHLDVRIMGAPELYLQFKPDMIDADGNVANDDTRKFLQGYAEKMVGWVGKQAGK